MTKHEFEMWAKRLAQQNRLFHPDDANEVVPKMFPHPEEVYEKLRWARENGIDPCAVFLRAMNESGTVLPSPCCDEPFEFHNVEDSDCSLVFQAVCPTCGRLYEGGATLS